VRLADALEIASVIATGEYFAYYDRNADGALNSQDYNLTLADLWKTSNATDRAIAQVFDVAWKYQTFHGTGIQLRLLLNGFFPGGEPAAGHGVHWQTQTGAAAITGYPDENGNTVYPELTRVDGLNVDGDNAATHGMFWGQAAVPVFEGGATDWPTPGGDWETQRVVSFADQPPSMTGDPTEMWHTHGGLCTVLNPDGEIELHQFVTYAECQEYPNSEGIDPVRGGNSWTNLWMVHLWLFDLNPNGKFGGTHPCVDPNAKTPVDFAEGREIPEFFAHHH